MSELKLLTEWCPITLTKDMINESREVNNGKLLLRGIIQRANTLNQNGRVYPRSILERARMQGDDVYGIIEILDTPSGKIIQSLIESGVTLGISSRGVGSTSRQGDSQIVQDDFQLICFDMVSEPSTPGAFMLREGKTISPKELNKVFNKSDRIDRIFNDILRW